jgi:hypothetical protein
MATTTTQSDEQIQKDVLAEWLFGNYCVSEFWPN